MSHPSEPLPCMFFCGCIHSPGALSSSLVEQIETIIGPTGFRTEPIAFTWTDYYSLEMGIPLERTFLFSGQLADTPLPLSRIKRDTYRMEQDLVIHGKRILNLDPGYLNAHQVVIATFKDFAHRIYLMDGVFGHLEYIFKSGKPYPLPWTYPDFRSSDYRKIFSHARSRYRKLWG